MSTLQSFLFATTCALMLGAWPSVARSEVDETRTAVSAGDVGPEAAQLAREKPRDTRSHRHARLSVWAVPEESLRQSPLGRPSGHLHLIFPGVKDEVEVNLFNEDGSYNLDALEQSSHLLRCRRTQAEKAIDPQLLLLLSHVEDHFDGKPLEIVSGYRNQRKQTSNHFKGKATDIRIAGVPPKKIREFAETLDGGGMGIGLYPRSGFVHIDVRPLPSTRWLDYSAPGSNAAEKRPPRGWSRNKLQS